MSFMAYRIFGAHFCARHDECFHRCSILVDHSLMERSTPKLCVDT